MKERPILMSAPMVRACLDGTKTQTRRVVKRQPANDPAKHHPIAPHRTSLGGWNWVLAETGHGTGDPFPCPYGQPGGRLRVKEAAWMWCERRPNGTTPTGRQKWHYVPMRGAPVIYAADHPAKPGTSVVSPDTGNAWGWRLKIGRFLPSWASRIYLEMTEVRVQRLQDISAADAVAEGIGLNPSAVDVMTTSDTPEPMAVAMYRDLWERINGAGSWAVNPWVWCLSFRRVEPVAP